ncbi:hypothetical protein K440DRAFT_653525 [Wilcoxina mikolae CBS 423.85]|nr:hypothetical protein K440DRAFT_653525 [Wilcoxina mikolae CBS 423.85]
MAPALEPERPTTPSKAGITVTADGQRIIPSSVRADGSARREIRVRPGYLPPEDVEVYKNRNAEAWKNRGSGGVPGAAPVVKPDISKTDANSRNAKRNAARKKAKEEKEKGEKEKEKGEKEGEPTPKSSESPVKVPTPAEEPGSAEATAEDTEKLAKAIRKKIRQAGELKTRKDGGESLLPEQLAKVIKMNELVRQLNALGFDQ